MFKKIQSIAVVGLGYVGAPLALALSRHFSVIGYDVSARRVAELASGADSTRELNPQELQSASWQLTTDPDTLRDVDLFIVTVPTPVTDAHVPDLGCVVAASRQVGKVMKKGAIVVYESTVYPGATEEECLPELVAQSGYAYPADFALGYSPERINPGDKVHRLDNTTKIVAGDRPEVLQLLAGVYGVVTDVHLAPTLKVAETAKVLENVQRDTNIGLINEVYQICTRIGVDIHDVLAAAGTKWNFLPFQPGLVGGHCISVDPYYLSHKAASEGFPARVIMAARDINDSMPAFIVDQLVKKMVQSTGINRDTVVTVLGATFKEDVPDIRNSKVADICRELEKFGIKAQVVDPLADPQEVLHELGVQPVSLDTARANRADALLLAVPHAEFVEQGWSLVTELVKPERALVMDIKARLAPTDAPGHVTYWR